MPRQTRAGERASGLAGTGPRACYRTGKIFPVRREKQQKGLRTPKTVQKIAKISDGCEQISCSARNREYFSAASCYRGGEGATKQEPGEYGLIATRHEQEGGVFRVDYRTGGLSICYLYFRREKQGDHEAIADFLVLPSCEVTTALRPEREFVATNSTLRIDVKRAFRIAKARARKWERPCEQPKIHS